MKNVALLLVALALVGCVGIRGPQYVVTPLPSTDPIVDGDAELTTMTWNVGLAPGIVPWVQERREATMHAVASSASDIVCLQEVWLDSDRQAMTKHLEDAGYRVYAANTSGRNENRRDRCDRDDLQSLLGCVREECADREPEEHADCAVSRCRKQLAWLWLWHRRCLNCLVASMGQSADSIAQTCTTSSASRAYGGGNGVILASRLPTRNVEAMELRSSGANRVAVFARVIVPHHGEVEVACTHLSSRQAGDPTAPGFRTWEDETGYQLRTTAKRLRVRSQGTIPEMLMGDLNFSATIPPDIFEILPRTRTLAGKLGFSAPAENIPQPFCSWCRGNLVSRTSCSRLLDQVLVRQPDQGSRLSALSAERRFDDIVTVTYRHGGDLRTHRSDHYAVIQYFRFVP